jgi:predicted MFS family arabinose efflux permease
MDTKKKALTFILLLGIVSLFADIAYEGARSIVGPYLSLLGASGAIVGTVVGLGEFIGYSLRVVFGYWSDKSQKYWTITFLGYLVNFIAVPLFAFAGSWKTASLLIILERLGKAIRSPARDAMLSYATKEVGRGWGFALHNALDRVGAILGPLLISLIFLLKQSYFFAFLSLALPALIALFVLGVTRFFYPRPQEMETTRSLEAKGLSRVYWIYIFSMGLVATGYADFAFIAYHFEKTSILSPAFIPLFYAIATGADGITTLFIGRIFDIKGISVLILITALSSLFAPLVFLTGFCGSLIGIILWGIGIGSQETVMKALVAIFVAPSKRASAYGLLNFVFGALWFVGSASMGVLYDYSPIYVVLFSLFTQMASLPLLFWVKRQKI